MKKLFILLTIFLLPTLAKAEVIHSFTSDITLSQDGSFTVSETIQYDYEGTERHGIFRQIPISHLQPSERRFHERNIDIAIESVTQDGAIVPYQISYDLGEMQLKIGDPDRTITGVHTYVITYQVRGGLSYYESGEAELYWNVTGNGWEVPIENALAEVHDPDHIMLDEARCYVGYVGEDTECAINKTEDTVVFGGVSLKPGTGLTIAQALDPSAVEKLVVERWSLWSIWLFGALAWLVGLTVFLYRYLFANKTHASIIAQYEPYEDFKPMYTGLLFDGRIDSRDITASIVYLAEQGFFKIKHVGRKKFFFIETDDYEIALKRPYDEIENEFQKNIFTLIFDSSSTVGETIVLSELAKNTSKQKENYKLVNSLKSAAEKDLVAQGFFEYGWRKQLKTLASLLVVILGLLWVTSLLGAAMDSAIAIGAITFFVSLILLVVSYRRRTRKGYEALDYLKGFKEFLSVTDKERFKFHNAPQKSPEQFMTYLPYAIAFGVEKEWAEAFKDITIPEPDWYEGQGTTFSAVYLSQSLGTFGTVVTNASGSSPASSGGGSVGGGAGGGGGGSW